MLLNAFGRPRKAAAVKALDDFTGKFEAICPETARTSRGNAGPLLENHGFPPEHRDYLCSSGRIRTFINPARSKSAGSRGIIGRSARFTMTFLPVRKACGGSEATDRPDLSPYLFRARGSRTVRRLQAWPVAMRRMRTALYRALEFRAVPSFLRTGVSVLVGAGSLPGGRCLQIS
jgi:hypothetical protein